MNIKNYFGFYYEVLDYPNWLFVHKNFLGADLLPLLAIISRLLLITVLLHVNTKKSLNQKTIIHLRITLH